MPGLKPQETPLRPYLHARSPRASRNGAGAASRACSVISQWPVAPHHMTLPTNARRPRSRLLVARWSQTPLVCSAWLLAVETSDPDQAFRYASACEGLLRRMFSPGGSLNGHPPPPPSAFEAWTQAAEYPRPGGLGSGALGPACSGSARLG